MESIALGCLFLAALELDDVQVGQFMLSRPIFAGCIAGIFTGRIVEGLQLGIFTELLFWEKVPVGGVILPSGLITVVSAAFIKACAGQIDISITFAWGIIMGYLYARWDMFMRNVRSGWARRIEERIFAGDFNIGFWLAKAVSLQIFVCWIFLFAAVVSGIFACRLFQRCVPGAVTGSMSLLYFAVPWAGMTMLLFRFWPKRIQAGG